MKKVLTVLLAMVLLMGLIPAVAMAAESSTADLTISTVDELIAFANAVNSGNAYSGEKVVLAKDIDLAGKPWPGIGVYKEQGVPDYAFQGTFDGQGHTISNVTFANASVNKYRGFFNQLYNATVKNLTVEVVGFEASTTDSYGGAAIAGFAHDTTIDNCVSTGKLTGTHNVAGIVVRIEDATIKNCTNKANLTGSYSKMGGIVNLSQNSDVACLIEGCVNEGTITSTARGEDGVGGIIGYIGYPSDGVSADGITTTIKNCQNMGVITATETAMAGQIVGYPHHYWEIPDGNKGRTDMLAVGTTNPGYFMFATVSDGVATYVSRLEAGNTYLVTAKSAKPAFTVLSGESITFDTSLATMDDSDIKTETHESGNLVKTTNGSKTTYSVPAVAKLSDKKYSTLQLAIDAATSGQTVKLIKDITESGIIIPSDKDLTIDFDRYTVNGDFKVYGKAAFEKGTIINTANKSGIELNNNETGASPNAEMTLADMTITSNRHALRIDGGTATINSGTYTCNSTNLGQTSHAVNISTNATVVINDGTFIGAGIDNGGGAAVATRDSGTTLTINGGTFKNENDGQFTIGAWGGILSITDGVFHKAKTDSINLGGTLAPSGSSGQGELKGIEGGVFQFVIDPEMLAYGKASKQIDANDDEYATYPGWYKVADAVVNILLPC